jgi:regulation of enolase protein 1 (concanavalin A-like superfamily)
MSPKEGVTRFAPGTGLHDPEAFMLAFRWRLSSLFVLLLVAGSPARSQEGGKPIRNWGTALDPDGDYKIRPVGSARVIDVPASLHDLNVVVDKYNSPRVVFDVDGDFTTSVKIVGSFRPGRTALKANTIPYIGAGIFLSVDEKNYLLFERAATLRDGKPGNFAHFEQFVDGARAAVHNGPLAAGTAYLRLERRGTKLSGEVSKDGKRWTLLEPIQTSWPAQIRVGLNALNTSDTRFLVRFEEFTLKDAKGRSLRDPANAPKAPAARVAAGRAQDQTRAASPEDVARQAMGANAALRFDDFARTMDPAALKAFHTDLAALLNDGVRKGKGGTVKSLLSMFGAQTVAEFQVIKDEAVLAIYLRSVAARITGYKEMMAGTKNEILGRVDEGQALAHVVCKATPPVDQGGEPRLVVMSARKVGDSWRLLLGSDVEAFVSSLKQSLADEPLSLEMTPIQVESLGRVPEGKDTLHLVYRGTRRINGSKVAKLNVLTLRRGDPDWSKASRNDPRELTDLIRRRVAPER